MSENAGGNSYRLAKKTQRPPLEALEISDCLGQSLISLDVASVLICAISHGDHFETPTSVLSLASVNFFLHALTIQR